MKNKITQSINIPEGITCTYQNKILICKKDSSELSKKIIAQNLELIIQNNTITIQNEKANKKDYKKIMSVIAHIKNIFRGLIEEFTYKLEIANVHFPMSLKVEGDKVSISNFLGEKVPRHAKILPKVKVEIKSPHVTITSHDKESAGQTAANLEKATKIRGRDRRIYQDGIFITEKPGRKL